MHDQDNVEILREEAQVLLTLNQGFLTQMSDKGILSGLDTEVAQSTFKEPKTASETQKLDQATIDMASVKREIATLRGEALKLTELEVVLAVVGTMKAGKSTTINAIVGTEILPNRNAPMTAIPTLIKHCKGQKQPRLIFTDKASKPANQLIQALKKAFKDKKNQSKLEQLQLDKDLYATVEKIRDGMTVVNEALGEQLIFEFLISINDLVRIAPIFDLEFPFDQYQEVDQLPVIEVEFAHLKDAEDHNGKLILLDTPGPNEAGQAHLRPMLQDQLKKASAVLAVMDYTQLKSEADAQVREDLKGIANTVKNRIYALVNKFDNCDRNGMQENEVKTFVEGLTDGLIKQGSVYPVAAKFGYLANRARHERLEDGSLPDVEHAVWVEDFYQEAGLRREMHRTPERISEGIDDLWEESRFSEPLKDVIEASHKKAALIALDSAVDKLEECSEKMNTVLSIKEQAMKKSAIELQTLVAHLSNDIEQINQTELKAEQSVHEYRDKFSEKINALIKKEFNSVRKEVNESIFSGNKISKNLKEENKTKSKGKRNGWGGFSLFSDLLERFSEDVYYDKNDPIIDFGDNKKEAQKFLKGLTQIIMKSNDVTNQNIETELTMLLDEFEEAFKDNIIVEAQKTIQQINNTLNQGGFEDIELNLPNRKNLSLKISSAKLMQNALIVESYDETRSRVVDSKLGRFKNWFNDEWGREEYTVSVKEYKVDMDEIKQQIEDHLVKSLKQLNQSIVKNIEKPLELTTKQFFSDFKRKVSGLRKDITNSLKDKEKSKQDEAQYLNVVIEMKSACQEMKSRTQVLKKAVVERLQGQD